ncbi:MAG TPA: NADH-quinone oxidoreductase subunit NuoH [Coriobacteriia bacterium]|nr:NADH-quinone oxidoreductase subunit NuoH [Coriobacteriia bacterium]
MTLLVGILRVLAALGLMLANGVVLIYMLRKVLGRLHLRLGPTELGPAGMFQTTADVLKLLTKEDPTPTHVDKVLYFIAPAIVFVPSLAAYAALPFSSTWTIANLDLGLLYTFAILSLVPLGVVAAGWSSFNKWSLIGAMRAVASQVSYEVPMLLAALPPVMIAGSLNMGDIARAQDGFVWFWLPCLPAFLLFIMAGLIEVNQTPFDMSEADSELVAGYATEYSSMKFGLLFLAEFSNTFIFAALLVTLFLGGWNLPLIPDEILFGIGAPVIFLIKTYLVIFVFMWIRGTLPRVRIDQLLAFGWKVLLPLSLAWVMVTAVGVKLWPVLLGGVR